MWVQAGRPCDGIVFNYMKVSRSQYKYAIRHLKRKQSQMRYQKMASHAANDNSRDFFAELKKLNPKKIQSNMLNGKTGASEIATVLAEKYKVLYNKGTTCPDELQKLKNSILNDSTNNCIDNTVLNITPDVVKTSVMKLKRDKSDGDIGFNSSHLILGGEALFQQLSGLFRAIFVHGHQPDRLLQSTIASNPKDLRGNLCVDANYMGIALYNSTG